MSLFSKRSYGKPSLKVSTQRKDVVGLNIRPVEDFNELYELGEEVMPSTHPGIHVRLGRKRIQPGDSLPPCMKTADVVIKTRSKTRSFRSKKDERSWRQTTDNFLSVPTFRNIAQVYEVLEDSDTYYIVMEKLDGYDLFELIANTRVRLGKGEVLPWTKEQLATHICKELLKALVHLHENGLIHKDLKLENVVLHPESDEDRVSPTRQSVVLIDFDTVEPWCPLSPAAKDILGTDQYIAPEAYAGNYSPKSDVFAVGVIIYKLLTSAYPFDESIFNDEPGENYVGSPKMKEIKQKVSDARVDFDRDPWPKMPLARVLVRSMLAVDENERVSAEDALKSEWMRSALAEDDKLSGSTTNSTKDTINSNQSTGSRSFGDFLSEVKM